MAQEELDLSTEGAEDLEGLAQKIETFYKQDMSDKLLRAYTWDEAIRFYDGDQHIEYNVSTNRFQQVTVTRNNDFIPRPITNYILPSVKTVVSQLTKQKPEAMVRPNSSDPRDIAAAKVSDLILDVKYEELREEEKQQEKAYWGVITGTVFKKIFWNNNTNKILKIPRQRPEPQLAVGDTLGEPSGTAVQTPDSTPGTLPTSTMPRSVDGITSLTTPNPENVEQEYDEIPIGDVDSAVVPPFNIAIPLNTRSPLEMDWIMEYSIQKIDWIKSQYDQKGDGYTGEAKNVTEEKDLSTVLQLEYRLRTLSGRRSGGHYATGSSGYIDIKNSAVLKEFYEKPSKTYPKGRMVVVANGKTLYSGDSPYFVDGFEDSWNPYVEWRFEVVPGRAWGKGLVDELIPINRRINAIDALIILNRKTMAIPQWLVPDGCGVPKGYINGRPGLNIPYRPVGANGAKPEKVMPSSLPAQVYDEREQAIQDIKRLGMTMDVLEGTNPTGVKTAYQLEQLQENAIATFGSTFQRWEKSFEREQTKILLLVANRYKEPRPEFGKKLKNINKDITDMDLEMFLGEDLKDNVNVRVEAGSSIPRSKAGENAVLREMIQNGILNLSSNVSRRELMDKMGVKGFDLEQTPDIKRAQWENGVIENGDVSMMVVEQTPFIDPMTGMEQIDPMTGQPAMQDAGTVLELDDHISHITIHAARMKDPNVTQEIRMKYKAHIEEHLQHQARGVANQSQAGAAPMHNERPQQNPNQQGAEATGGIV